MFQLKNELSAWALHSGHDPQRQQPTASSQKILDHLDDVGGRIFATISEMSEICGLKRRATINALNRLVGMGLIGRKRGGGRGNPNEYWTIEHQPENGALKGALKGAERVHKGCSKGCTKGAVGMHPLRPPSDSYAPARVVRPTSSLHSEDFSSSLRSEEEETRAKKFLDNPSGCGMGESSSSSSSSDAPLPWKKLELEIHAILELNNFSRSAQKWALEAYQRITKWRNAGYGDDVILAASRLAAARLIGEGSPTGNASPGFVEAFLQEAQSSLASLASPLAPASAAAAPAGNGQMGATELKALLKECASGAAYA